MVNSIRAELYKLTHRAYFYGFNLCCAAFALLVVGCLCYIKFAAAPSAELVNFPFALTPLYLGMPIGLYLVMLGGDAVFSEQYKYNTLKMSVLRSVPHPNLLSRPGGLPAASWQWSLW